jgi:hypothetical protein
MMELSEGSVSEKNPSYFIPSQVKRVVTEKKSNVLDLGNRSPHIFNSFYYSGRCLGRVLKLKLAFKLSNQSDEWSPRLIVGTG